MPKCTPFVKLIALLHQNVGINQTKLSMINLDESERVTSGQMRLHTFQEEIDPI